MKKALEDTQKGYQPVWYLTCFLIGTSATLFSAFTSFEPYIVMRSMGYSPLQVQGLWYFVKRTHFFLALIVILMTMCTSVTKCVVAFLGWALCVSYGLFSAYHYCFPDFDASLGVLKGILLACSIFSTASQSSFFFSVFNIVTPKALMKTARCVVCFLLGSCFAAFIPRVLISQYRVTDSTATAGLLDINNLLNISFHTCTGITFLSASLTSFVTYTYLESPCTEYLTLSLPKVLSCVSNRKCLIPVFLCSLGFVLSSLSGFASYTFLFNLPLSDGHNVITLQNSIYIALTCLFLLFSFYGRYFEHNAVYENSEIGVLRSGIGAATMNTETVEKLEGINTLSSSEEKSSATSMIRSIFRSPQPWSLLPTGFWTEWERSDNDDGTYMLRCMDVYSVIAAVREPPSAMADDYPIPTASVGTTFQELLKAKHALIGVVSSFVSMCESAGESLQRDLMNTSVTEKCPYEVFKGELVDFIKHCHCVNHNWIQWNCTTCVYKAEAASGNTTQALSPPGAVQPSAVTTTVSTNGSPAIVTQRVHYDLKTMRTTFCHMGARLINCVRSANSLISDIRKSPALSEDLDDVSMHQAADALDKFFLQFLVLLTCFRVVEGWIVLCKCMDKVLKGCAEVVKAWKEKRRCSSASLSHGDAKGLSICGCVCLIKLADCCKTLHEKQCEIVEEILNSSPSTNHPMPSVAHTRSLTLLVYCFGAVMKSKLASESGDCKCKQSTKRVDQCDCCRYSGRLFDLLSRWLRDVSSMGFGDTLLRETIELFSYVVSPDTTNNNETYPNVMQRLHKFVGVSRSTAMQAYKLRGSTNTTTDVDHQVGNFINVGPGLKEVPQFCCTCEQKCTQDSCYCYLMECEYSKNNDKCSLEILTKLHTLKDAAKLENIKQCLTNMSGTLKSVSDKLKGASSAAQKDLYCVDGTVSKVKSFFEKSIGDDSHTTASGHSGKAMFCSVACTNKQLAVFLLYNCNSAANNHVSTSDNCASGSGAASTSHQACSGDLCGKCADPNCKSLYCTISRLTCTLYGNGTAEQHQTQCNCTKKDSTNSCCCGTNSLCSILCECSSKLDELKKKLGDNAGLVTEVQHTCDKVSDVKMEMGEITKCLKVFAAECQYYEEHLDSTQATIYYLFREEIDHIRDLQKFLDENCEAYEAAVSSMTKVVSSTAALSSQHQRDVFFLDTEVDKVTKNVNATCDRATSIQDELAKCMAGLDAEKRSIVMAPKTYQPLVHRNSEKRLPLGISTLKESMWYFDMLWMFCFGFCLLYSWYYSSSKSWLYHTARNFIVLLAIKGIMTLNSYLLVLCGFRRHQSYLINIALFIGFLIAICMSWVSQWWNYTLFLRENCKPIEHWFRFVYPNTMASTGSGSLTWFRGIVSLMSADFNYLKSLLTSASFEGYHYNPFGTIFDDYFRLQNRPIGYLGACDWNSFNTELRQDLIVAAKKGKLQCLLDYLAFKSASEVDWSFLFGATTFNIDKFPTDLLWAAWNMHEKLTLERCVSYSLLEAAYTRVYNSIKAVVDSANGDDEQLPLVLDDFDTEQRNYLAYNAISVPNFTDLQGTAGQMDSLFKFFEDDFKQEWYDYYSYISSTTDDVPDTREGTSTSSDADKTMIIDRTKLEEAVETWRTKRTDACENIYGGSAVCHRLVTSTVAMLERYLSELRQTGKAYSPFKLLKFCDSYVNQDFIGDHNDIREIADSTPSSNGPSDESTVSETGREFDPSGEHSYDYTSINLGVRQKVTISEQHELLEMYDLQHFLLGFWLKHAGVSVTTTDVKQVLTFLYSESRVL